MTSDKQVMDLSGSIACLRGKGTAVEAIRSAGTFVIRIRRERHPGGA